MNAARVDAWIRSLTAPAGRRAALRTLAGAVGGAVGLIGREGAAAGCKAVGKKCQRGDRCCGGAKCTGKKCTCRGGKVACNDGRCQDLCTCEAEECGQDPLCICAKRFPIGLGGACAAQTPPDCSGREPCRFDGDCPAGTVCFACAPDDGRCVPPCSPE